VGQSPSSGKPKDRIRRATLRAVLLVAQVCFIVATLGTGYAAYRAWQVWAAFPVHAAAASDASQRIGIIAGHLDNDSGAVCPDGLLEVDINTEVANRVARMLRLLGHEAEVLSEYADALTNYRAGALVSIHSDSCLPGRSGFKVARVVNSAIPEEEDRLVACLYREYERATGLARDEATITVDMEQYHAFAKIAADTPGAIIEIGFMGGDRKLLTKHPDRVARGIVAGIACFLEPAAP